MRAATLRKKPKGRWMPEHVMMAKPHRNGDHKMQRTDRGGNHTRWDTYTGKHGQTPTSVWGQNSHETAAMTTKRANIRRTHDTYIRTMSGPGTLLMRPVTPRKPKALGPGTLHRGSTTHQLADTWPSGDTSARHLET